VTQPRTIHQSKFSMGFVLALIARERSASIVDFSDQALQDAGLKALASKVEMVVDPEIDRLYPGQWSAVVEVRMHNGNTYVARTDVPKGDPGNRLTRSELEDKARRLAAYNEGAGSSEIERIISAAWQLEKQEKIAALLPPLEPAIEGERGRTTLYA
jgi:2-methylcitrate dehydratase PrpD